MIASIDILAEYDIMGSIFYYPDFTPIDVGLTGFEDVGMDSWYFTQNLGTLFLIIVGYIFGIVSMGILLLVKFPVPLEKLKMIFAKKIYWNSVLRLVIEAYFDILLGVGITY